MPPARSALPALTDIDVTELRAQLDRGATPRVRLRAGGTGTVVSVGDPDDDGGEYFRVKVTLNGTRDTLPFAPEDLASTSRGAKAAEVNDSTPSQISTTPRRRPLPRRPLPRRPRPPEPPPPSAGRELAELFDVARSTVYRAIERAGGAGRSDDGPQVRNPHDPPRVVWLEPRRGG